MKLSSTLLLIASLTPIAAWAQESYSVGPRHLGMGGAGVAVVDDVPASYYNPAAYGFFGYGAPPSKQSGKAPVSADNDKMPVSESTDKAPVSVDNDKMPVSEGTDKAPVTVDNNTLWRRGNADNNALWRKDFGMAVDFSVGVRIHKDFAEHLDTLREYYDAARFADLGNLGIQNESDARAMIEIAAALGNLSDPENSTSVDVNTGVMVRVGHFGLGVRAFSHAAMRLQSFDTTNLGIGGAPGQANNTLAVYNPTGWTSGDPVTTLSSAQQAQLSAAGYSADNISKIDNMAKTYGVDTNLLQLMINTLVGMNGPNSLENNTSSARVYGVGIIEIPLSYGYAFNEHLAIGGNIKGMIGHVYGYDVLVFAKDADEQFKDAQDNYKQSLNVGLDLSVMYRMRMLNLGLIARNINAPTFDGPTIGAISYDDYTLDPSVAAGVAFIPFETLSFTADLDLTTNESILNNYDTQMLRVGGEWNVFRFLALRGGYSTNLAESDIGGLVHAGVGLNLWAIRLDVAGAMSLEKTSFDDTEIPREARGALQLAVDF
jgi:F plasmid transfer operon, TraF, protein